MEISRLTTTRISACVSIRGRIQLPRAPTYHFELELISLVRRIFDGDTATTLTTVVLYLYHLVGQLNVLT